MKNHRNFTLKIPFVTHELFCACRQLLPPRAKALSSRKKWFLYLIFLPSLSVVFLVLFYSASCFAFLSICPKTGAHAFGSSFEDIRAEFDGNDRVYGAVSLVSATPSGPHKSPMALLFFLFFYQGFKDITGTVFKCSAVKQFLSYLPLF